ncbi:protein of unknown function [Ferrimonas sediminum]|uniref:DUF748 domain-containing protein n=1 Tax=Ferrimonas sediminum TaxID=718193 RepID=A0A1G8MEB8_9GAMM|nr:DUF748 domain-containing protein [Ferrimonas sediminum]SDI66246.1 protein of unknown function [Ferrimonas sediminum]
MDIKTVWARPWIKRITVVLALFGLYLLLSGWVLPRVIERQLPQLAGEQLNGQLTLEQAQFHPLTWQLQLHRLALVDVDGQSLAGLEHFSVDLDPWRSLFSWQACLREVSLTAPYVNYVEREGGDSNLMQVLAPLLATPSAEPSPSASSSDLPGVTVDRFHLSQGRVQYQQQDGASTELTQLQLQATELALAAQDNRLQLDLTGKGGGTLSLTAVAGLNPLTLNLDGQLKRADLTRYWPFVARLFEFELEQGRLDAQFGLRLAQQGDDLELALAPSRVTLNDLALTREQQPLLNLDSLSATGVELSLLEQRVGLDSVTLSGGQASMRLDPQGLDWARLMAERRDSTPPPPGEAPPSPWQVNLARLQLRDLGLAFTDTTQPEIARWRLDLDQAGVGPISTDLSQAIEVSVTSRVNERSPLTFDGQLVPQPFSLTSRLSLAEFALTDTLPYWQSLVPLSLTQGQLATQGSLTIEELSPLALSYDGELTVTDLVTQDPDQGRDFVKWQSLKVADMSLTTLPLALSIDTVAVNQPYARVIIEEDGSTNIQALIAPSGTTPASSQPEEAQTQEATSEPMAIAIKRIELNDGGAFFADNSLTPKFATGIETLGGSIEGLSSNPASRAVVDIQGQVDRYAPMSLTGELQPLAVESFIDLALTFDNLDLTSLNAYSGTYAGYYIDQGQLDLALHYALEDRMLRGSNQVVIDKLKLGKRSDSDKATSLPVALAIALMQDANGVIDLGLEVSGNVDEPDFAIGPLVGKALFNAITKIVTSPFSLLGSLLGGEEPANEVMFLAGSHQVPVAEKGQLKQLVSALTQRPKLTLSVQGAVMPAVDGRALAKARLDPRLGATGDVNDQAPDPALEEALRAAYDATRGTGAAEALKAGYADNDAGWRAELYRQLLAQTRVADDELAALAAARADAVKRVLSDDLGLEANRVFIRESRVELDRSGTKVILELDAGN